jgi:hypothetical protein
MKNRYSLFIMGAILMAGWGCQSQPKQPVKPACTNPQQSDNDDSEGDDGAYGDSDTSTQRKVEDASPADPTYTTVEVAEQNELIDQAMEHVAMALADAMADDAANEESASKEEPVLEAVPSIELPSTVVMVEESAVEATPAE